MRWSPARGVCIGFSRSGSSADAKPTACRKKGCDIRFFFARHYIQQNGCFSCNQLIGQAFYFVSETETKTLLYFRKTDVISDTVSFFLLHDHGDNFMWIRANWPFGQPADFWNFRADRQFWPIVLPRPIQYSRKAHRSTFGFFSNGDSLLMNVIAFIYSMTWRTCMT